MKIKFKKVLAIGAHFDDIEICSGGTIAKFCKAGSEVKIVVVGDGDYQNYDGTVIRTNSIAVDEGIRAIESLGVDSEHLIALNHPEKKIIFDEKLIGEIEKIIDDFKPDLIITHWLHDCHQDHVAVANAVISAARYYQSIWMWEPIFPSGRVTSVPFVPQIYVDMSNFGSIKNEALKLHKSQYNKFYRRGIKWIESIEARAKFRGFESNAILAETFFVYRQKID